VIDSYDLARFVDAQERCYGRVLEELGAGKKTSHWMWFIFPQLRGLGVTATAQRYGLTGLAEARAYLAHPLLGARLRECTRRLLDLEGLTAHDIFSSPDDLKLRSCLTLFAHAVGPAPAAADRVFSEALSRYYRAEPDPRTLGLLTSPAS
jgi:uncharacterized protein (DUF1810 family)